MGLIIVGLITKKFHGINHNTEDFVVQEWTLTVSKPEINQPPKKLKKIKILKNW